jgi:hypothetical protein
LFIFLDAFRDPFVIAAEAASQSSLGTRVNLHKVEAAEEGLLLGESAEYTASRAPQSAPIPMAHPRFHCRQPKQSFDFHQRSSFSRLMNNIITWRRRQCVGPQLLNRSPQPLRWRRSRSLSGNGRSWKKLLLCNTVASASPTPPRKPSRREATLYRQNPKPRRTWSTK